MFPALERRPVNLAAFMQTDTGELLFAMRTNDMHNIGFHNRRYAQHLPVLLQLSMITQMKRRLVAINFQKRKYAVRVDTEKEVYTGKPYKPLSFVRTDRNVSPCGSGAE